MLVEEYSKTIRHELLKVFWVMLSWKYGSGYILGLQYF